ncbi:transposase [Pseudomonas sp. 2FE]|uniref:REP-associated tyrosine transposase n=1 Tax=Pseudomonas sp. 2FE TaxID=2502190 RepID=UPI0010F797ED|nr:transposase [Pseudomonas sp. 2FE]
MSNYRRARHAGELYFFTLVTERRRPLLTNPELQQSLRGAILDVRTRYPFSIHGWVLLPDHMHCIWQLPLTDTDFSRRWSLIKRHVSQSWQTVRPISQSQQARRESGLWQRRFWEHCIRDEQDYRRHMDYLHWNPVKHGLVARAADWPWSSFHRLVREGVYPADWGSREETEENFGE